MFDQRINFDELVFKKRFYLDQRSEPYYKVSDELVRTLAP